MKVLISFISAVLSAGCALFDVECDVHDGFKITINESCKSTEDYKGLPADNSGLFVYAESFVDDPDKLTPADLNDDCKFKDKTEVSVGFNTCGASVFTPSTNTSLGFYKVYVIHQQELAGIAISEMDQNEIICKFSDAELETRKTPDPLGRGLRPGEVSEGLEIAENDEKTAAHLLDAETLTSEFDLDLIIGIERDDTFIKHDTNIPLDNGQLITVKLDHKATANAFSFVDCRTSDGKLTDAKVIELYDKNCPKAGLNAALGLERKTPTAFSISIFRIGNSDKITFSCNVHLYPDAASVPNSCSRKRRSEIQELDTKESQVSVTVKLAKENIEIRQDTSSTISFMCNIIVVSVALLIL